MEAPKLDLKEQGKGYLGQVKSKGVGKENGLRESQKENCSRQKEQQMRGPLRNQHG